MAEISPTTDVQKARTRERGARFLMTSASLVLVLAGLRAVKPIALPLLLAIFLSILSAPLMSALMKRRFPKLAAVILTVLANVLVMVALLLLIGTSINGFAASVPKYQERVEAKVDHGLDWLELQGFDVSALSWLDSDPFGNPETQAEGREAGDGAPILGGAETPGDAATFGDDRPVSGHDPTLGGLINFGSVFELVASTLRSVATILSLVLLVFLLMIFILFEAPSMPRKLKTALGWSARDSRQIMREIQRYLVIKTLVSLATGLLVGLGLWLMGIEYALLWALIAYLLNYIPSIGSIIASVPTVLLAWIDSGLGQALLVILLYLSVNLSLGNFLEPHLMGRGFGISTLIVVLSLLFWGWLWGPLGMLLSVPLTVVLKILMENTEDFRWLAQLIGANPRPAAALAGGALEIDDASIGAKG